MNSKKNILYPSRQNTSGFTLVEMAIVLGIIALLLGGLLPTISGQIEQAQRKETRNSLTEIKQALLGYAIINGQLPCPTTIADPAHADYGVAPPPPCAAPTAEEYLPWKTLGVSEVDSWGLKRLATTDPWIGYWRYRLDDNFGTTFTLATVLNDALTINNNDGNVITAAPENPVAIVYSTGADITPNGENAGAFDNTYQGDYPNKNFDDILIWISRPQLFNRMVQAGRLP